MLYSVLALVAEGQYHVPLSEKTEEHIHAIQCPSMGCSRAISCTIIREDRGTHTCYTVS